ncbi:MAG: FAD-linked oxidase C-terminal domain-containing protein [Bacillota bacterium]
MNELREANQRTLPPQIVHELNRVVGHDGVLCRVFDRTVYQYDGTSLGHLPLAVVLPRTPEQVAACLAILTKHGLPVITRGAGTNLSGATTFVTGQAVIVETSRMNRLIDLDQANARALVEPGLRNQELQDAVVPLGRFYPPDPASMAVSTLGGNVAENSGGPKCIKYGVTNRWVSGLEVALSTGDVVHTGGVSDYTPGYDLTGVLIGSEGNFGVITKAWLKLNNRPGETRTLLAIFNRLDDAAQTVSYMIAAGVTPATIELIDDVVLQAVEQNVKVGYPLDAEAVLLIEVDGTPEAVAEDAARVDRICREHGAREVRAAASEQERELLWRGRREAVGSLARLRPSYAEEDVGVPPSLLPEMLRTIKDIGKRYDLVIGNVFHAGDGNFHPVVLYDERDADESRRMHEANFEIMKAAAAMGGTITGEHGVGRLKLPGMPLMFSRDELVFMAGLKRVFDPSGLLNPGKVIPPAVLENQAATAVVRPPVPAEVAEVLAEAGAKGLSVVPTGAGTKLALGPRQDTPSGAVRLDLGRLPKVLDFDRDNLIIRVSAGIGLAELQAKLAPEGFFFPADPYFAGQATIGGVLATGDAGSYRPRYGEVKDNVLGLSVALADGRRLHFGGRTVKNVAGFDVKRLLIGSWGTLGVILDATIRVYPIPETETVSVAFTSVDGAGRFVAAVRARGDVTPAALDFADFDPRATSAAMDAGRRPTFRVYARFEGSPAVTAAHISRLVALAETAGGWLERLSAAEATALWKGRTETAAAFIASGRAAWMKVGYAPAGLAELHRDLAGLAGAAGAGLAVHAHAGNGIADAFVFPSGRDAPGDLARLAEELGHHGGSLYPMARGPWSGGLGTLYGRRDDARLAAEVKRYFDPADRFGVYRV